MIGWSILIVAMILTGVATYFITRRLKSRFVVVAIPTAFLISGIVLAMWSSTEPHIKLFGVLIATFVLLPSALSTLVGAFLGRRSARSAD